VAAAQHLGSGEKEKEEEKERGKRAKERPLDDLLPKGHSKL
jgi:hypothetical protein